MAYPVVTAPYGFRPVNRLDGLAYAGVTRDIPIVQNYATAIFNGDLVQIDTNGNVIKSTVNGADTTTYPVGVFIGCYYTLPQTGQRLFSQFYPGNINATDITAKIVDDPFALFKVAVVSAGTTIGTLTRAAVGANGQVVQNAGNTLNGDSAIAISTTVGTTATTVRIVDVVLETSADGINFTEVIVKINNHQWLNQTGV